MTTKRKIVCAESSRAEHGHLFWVLRELQQFSHVELGLVLTGAHLVPQLGSTAQEVRADGFQVWDEVDSTLAADTDIGCALSLAATVEGFSRAFARIRPDLLLLLGDRYETLGAASAAMMLRIPVAHIHGGETTEGAIDDAARHAITKLSHYHFPVTEEYARRIVQMGESPERVFCCGVPGLDHLSRTTFLSRSELEQQLSLPLPSPFIIVTFHPPTLQPGEASQQMSEMLRALEQIPGDVTIVFTCPNQDAEGRRLIALIEAFCQQRPGSRMYPSLGFKRFMSLMKLATAVVGNSSTGIIEAGAMNCPAVNIGERQRGRMRGPNVLDCAPDQKSIAAALSTALSAEFRKTASSRPGPYAATGSASKDIAARLAEVPLGAAVLQKRFHSVAQA